MRLDHLIGVAVSFGIGDGFFLGGEGELQLPVHIAAAEPAHQRVDLRRFGRLELEQPLARAGLSGLHRRLGWLIDTGNHDETPRSGLQRRLRALQNPLSFV